MPADLTMRKNGQTEMAYTGKAPWHGLGTYVDHPMTAEEAIELAGLDWEVEGRPALTLNSENQAVTVPGKQVLVRADTDEALQVFSTAYRPVQNKEAFSFFDGVVAAGEAVYETVGSLKGGRRVWILAKLPGDLVVQDEDVINKYILLANSHDGSMQVTMKITPVRVVCNNTLELGLFSDTGRQVKFRHTVNILDRINEARDTLGLAEAHFEMFMRQANRLAAARFTEKQVLEVAAQVFEFEHHKPFADQPRGKQQAANTVVELFTSGPGAELVTAAGTGWGAFNAFTAYIDHAMRVGASRSKTPDKALVTDQRLNSSWFGSGPTLRQKAWDGVMALAN